MLILQKNANRSQESDEICMMSNIKSKLIELNIAKLAFDETRLIQLRLKKMTSIEKIFVFIYLSKI